MDVGFDSGIPQGQISSAYINSQSESTTLSTTGIFFCFHAMCGTQQQRVSGKYFPKFHTKILPSQSLHYGGMFVSQIQGGWTDKQMDKSIFDKICQVKSEIRLL